MQTPVEIQQLLDGPAAAPPPDQNSNLVDPPTLFDWYIVTITLCVPISTLAIAMRIYTKAFLIRKLASDDCEHKESFPCIPLTLTLDLAVLGFGMWIGYTVPTSLLMYNGGGIHQWNVQLKSFMNFLYVAIIQTLSSYSG